MNRVLAFAACAMILVLPAVAQKGRAQKGGGSTTSNLPVINSISPSSKEAGSGAFVMTVTGSKFTTGSVARWNGTAISTGYVSSTQLAATVGSSLIVNTGTASVTVYTSGRKGGTSNTLSFTITAPTVTAPPPEPAPAPAPSPLSITTTSLPGGTAGAPLSCTVAATGGTPAYGWALVNGGGALPPGLTLSATGTISGTPTQSGTFTFTTQANDSASQIAQKVLSLTLAADPNATTTTTTTTTTTAGTVLFQTGFEDGTIPSGFNSYWYTNDVKPNSDPQFVHSGSYSAQFRYYICGATDGTCGGSSQDTNRWAVKYFNSSNGFPNGVDHMYIRGYVYFKSPEPDGTIDKIQRKMYYIFEKEPPASWSFMLTSYSSLGGLDVAFSTNNNAYVPAYTLWNIARLNFNRWYCIELEVRLDTPGSSDGQITLWVNGTQIYQKAGLKLRGSYTTGIGAVRVGEQANRGNYLPVNEYRYWDDIVMSTGPVGP